MLQTFNQLCGPLLSSFQEVPVFFELGTPELDTVFQTWLHQGRVEVEDHLSQPAGHCLFNASQDTIGFLSTRPHCWLMANLLSSRTPSSFSAELQSCRSVPNLYWSIQLSLHRCKTLHLLLLNHIRFLPARHSSLARSCWSCWHSFQVFQPLLPALYHQQTCWRWTLFLLPGHW